MKKLNLAVAALMAFATTAASASVILHGTRIVYPSNSKDVTIVAENNGEQPALVQAWLDNGSDPANLDKDEVPFVLTPPIFRLNQDKTQSIRIIYNKAPLPKDRESLFWLNVLEVPPSLAEATDQNALRVTFRTRIKMFFRPVEIKAEARKAASETEWSLTPVGNAVQMMVKNPTPFYVTFTKATATVNGKDYPVTGQMVAPFSHIELPVEGLTSTQGLSKVTYSFIDDMGATIQEQAKIAK